jgi:hypothetical protein
MSSVAISSIAFACVFGGALLGIFLRSVLPQNHLSAESKDVVKLGMGLVATMAALVLGLLVAAAKSSYDTQNTELTEMSSKVALLDRVLAHYGPDTKKSRDQLHNSIAGLLDQMWSKDGTGHFRAEPPSTSAEALYDNVRELSPGNDAQRSIQAEALSLVISLGQTRWLMYEQRTTSVSVPLLVALIFWLTIIFTSFGLFAPRNATVVASLFLSALAVSGSILLILEMYTPYAGLIRISSAPLRAALMQLGK